MDAQRRRRSGIRTTRISHLAPRAQPQCPPRIRVRGGGDGGVDSGRGEQNEGAGDAFRFDFRMGARVPGCGSHLHFHIPSRPIHIHIHNTSEEQRGETHRWSRGGNILLGSILLPNPPRVIVRGRFVCDFSNLRQIGVPSSESSTRNLVKASKKMNGADSEKGRQRGEEEAGDKKTE